MPHQSLPPVLRHIRKLVGAYAADDSNDARLIEHFVLRQDEAAFEALLERHGPMVLGVCRRLLFQPHDVEDASQATFLVLARKARSIARRELVGPWLYGVAYRIALKARAMAAQRRTRERQVAVMSLAEPLCNDTANDLRPIIDQEVQRLPAKYRLPIILCYLEGKTNDEAAEQLHCPTGTVKTRLTRGRDLLRSRLSQRGLALSAAGLATALTQGLAPAAVSAGLRSAACQTALLGLGAGPVSGPVAALAEAALQSMAVAKRKLVVSAGLLAGLLVSSAVWVGY